MPMEHLPRVVMAAAALCAVHDAAAGDKRSLTIGATVIAASQCRVEAATGPRCSGKAAPPRVVAASAIPSARTEFAGELVMKVSSAAASLDSRNTTTPHFERVVLTIAP